jgi:hypothetical protein
MALLVALFCVLLLLLGVSYWHRREVRNGKQGVRRCKCRRRKRLSPEVAKSGVGKVTGEQQGRKESVVPPSGDVVAPFGSPEPETPPPFPSPPTFPCEKEPNTPSVSGGIGEPTTARTLSPKTPGPRTLSPKTPRVRTVQSNPKNFGSPKSIPKTLGSPKFGSSFRRSGTVLPRLSDEPVLDSLEPTDLPSPLPSLDPIDLPSPSTVLPEDVVDGAGHGVTPSPFPMMASVGLPSAFGVPLAFVASEPLVPEPPITKSKSKFKQRAQKALVKNKPDSKGITIDRTLFLR